MSPTALAIAITLLTLAAFGVCLAATAGMIRLAPRAGLVDKPGHRKIHDVPKPLGGGVGIFLGVAVPMVIGTGVIGSADIAIAIHGDFAIVEWLGLEWHTTQSVGAALVEGARQQIPLALGFLAGGLAMFLLGLIDDKKALGPFIKLLVQLAVSGWFVWQFDTRLFTFLDDNTPLGTLPSILITVLWIAGVTNAFNFLDNMDGLCAGVAAVCSMVFLVAALIVGQLFVAAALALLIGALLGFLVFNFPPARIFMGDSGALFIGFVLGVLTVRTTYLLPGEDFAAGWYSVLVPVIVLALPLYDMVVVSAIRISRGRSPFVGDTNHFSHRLVARGMSRRTAVLTLYLITAATGVAAILLPLVATSFAAMLILIQTVLILGVVMLLEQYPLPRPPRENDSL